MSLSSKLAYQKYKEIYKKHREKNKEKRKLQCKEWHLKNKDKQHIYRKEYYVKNKKLCLKRTKEWRQTEKGQKSHREEAMIYYYKNREKILKRIQTPEVKEIKKRWSSNNKSKILFYAHKRRNLTKDLYIDVIQQVYEDNIKRFGTLTCILCFKSIEFGQDSLEHLMPLIKGGTNNYNNLGIAHLKCNLQKNKKTLTEWRKYYGEIISK